MIPVVPLSQLAQPSRHDPFQKIGRFFENAIEAMGSSLPVMAELLLREEPAQQLATVAALTTHQTR